MVWGGARSRGVHGPGGGAWSQGGGGAWSRGCMVPPTATAAGGTHPTGMHSCYSLVRLN